MKNWPIFIMLAGFIGCVLNIIALIMTFIHGGPITTLVIGRIIGVFVPIIGAVLGYV